MEKNMQLKVLFLDDEPLLCEIFSEMFAGPEISVRAFSDVNDAVQSATDDVPDIIFLDYRLPRTTGDQVAQKMPAHVPKYLVTGELEVKTVYQFNEVLGKPVDNSKIEGLLQNALQMKTQKKAA